MFELKDAIMQDFCDYEEGMVTAWEVISRMIDRLVCALDELPED
jgi:hypothetical protein